MHVMIYYLCLLYYLFYQVYYLPMCSKCPYHCPLTLLYTDTWNKGVTLALFISDGFDRSVLILCPLMGLLTYITEVLRLKSQLSAAHGTPAATLQGQSLNISEQRISTDMGAYLNIKV